MQTRTALFAALSVSTALAASGADADMVISNDATANMNCSAGVCTPTANDAVLNVGDLGSLLASGNLEITTLARHVHANPIVFAAPFSSSSSFSLTLEGKKQIIARKRISMQGAGGLVLSAPVVDVEAPMSILGSGNLAISGNTINIDNPVSIQGTSGLEIQADTITVKQPVSIKSTGPVIFYNNPYLLFENKGRITFAHLDASLTIGQTEYILENSLPGLAAAIAANPQGNFALANSYNARADGTYTSSPISTNFLGSLEGLGNAISNISVNDTSDCCVGGLFQSISEANVDNIRLTNLSVTSVRGAAGLAYESFGTITGTSVTGSVIGGGSGDTAGLVSDNYGTIELSYSSAAVSTGATVAETNTGGLVGVDFGNLSDSFATGAVSAGNGSGNVGGLVGNETNDQSSIANSYAMGDVSGGAGLDVGGLIGTNDRSNYTTTIFAYSTGAVSGGNGSTVGGLIGQNNSLVNGDYWDTTTSGTEIGVGLGNASGVTGLTTTQLQAGLPQGFETNTWAENPKINNGFPYLISNPPPE